MCFSTVHSEKEGNTNCPEADRHCDGWSMLYEGPFKAKAHDQIIAPQGTRNDWHVLSGRVAQAKQDSEVSVAGVVPPGGWIKHREPGKRQIN